MPDAKRMPGLGTVALGLLLVATLVGVWWWQFRPKPDSAPDASALAELDVVCLGRIDTLHPVISLEPAIPGKVAAILVAEGKSVTATTPLLRLDDEAAKLREAEAETAVAAANLELKAAQQDAAGFAARKEAAEAGVLAAASRLHAAEKRLDERRKQQMFTTITPAELASSEAEVEQYRQLEVAERARQKELVGFDPELPVAAARLKVKSAELALQQVRKAVRDCVLLAPSDGTVLRVMVSPGEMVAPGGMQPALVFRPAGPLVVRAELDQEFLGRVRKGQKAAIRDDARADAPVQNGTVERVGSWVARKRSLALEPGEMNDVRTVECVIVLDGPTESLLIGQRVRVRIAR